MVREYQDHPNTIAAIAWRSSSEELVSACYGQLQFWSLESTEVQRTCEWKGSMLSLAWSPDGRALNGLMAELIEGHLKFHVLSPGDKALPAQVEAAEELMAVVKRYFN